jgi:CRISPR-associated protein Csh2
MDKENKKEILFYYESRQNPNGDPGFENMPRQMSDGTILVTDVRIKRTIRDYAKDVLKKTIFVDYDKEGKPVTADNKAEELVGSLKGDVISELLKKTFDVPLFGALVPIRSKKAKDDNEGQEGRSEKITGPVQFALGRSVNQVQIINPTISGRFVGKEKGEGEQFSTFGKFYSVEYALIKFHGAVNPQNLGRYSDDKTIRKSFEENEDLLLKCLWRGTNELITRSKFPQRSVFLLEVTYKSKIYNDLPNLVDEIKEQKGQVKDLEKSPLIFEKFLEAVKKRKDEIIEIGIKACEELTPDAEKLKSELKKIGITTKDLE